MEVPRDIVSALERGELTQCQLIRLIAIEAAEIGLTYSEARAAARRGRLPKSTIGSDIDFLIEMLA